VEVKMKKTVLILLLFLSIATFSFQLTYGQQFSPLFLNARFSKNGLETSDYKKMVVLIEPLTKDARKIGLTKERVQRKCELRLRQAGLEIVPAGSRPEYLNININIRDVEICRTFSIFMEFIRPVLFEAEGNRYMKLNASTWKSETHGVFGNDPEHIIDALDKYLLSFLGKYEEANSK
jgi:hypothetical protein